MQKVTLPLGYLGKNDKVCLYALFVTYTSIVPYLFIFTGETQVLEKRTG
jgi:hypothetical protein